MIVLYKPVLDELDFRKSLLADPETMSYNDAWGGTIPFPQEDWKEWYQDWLERPDSERFYRYLYDTEQRQFVGEAAWHYDEERKIHICDVIVPAKYRNRGYGSEGLRLLCEEARRNGIAVLYDDIAADNPAWKLFLKNGFEIDRQDNDVVMVKKVLS